jgi:hypothetical protein
MTLPQMIELVDELHFLERQAATIEAQLADLDDGWRYTLKLIQFQIQFCRRCRDLERPELVEAAERVWGAGHQSDKSIGAKLPTLTADGLPGRVH